MAERTGPDLRVVGTDPSTRPEASRPSRRGLRVGAYVLAFALVAGAGVGVVELTSRSIATRERALGMSPELTDIVTLTNTGTCAEELRAEATYARAVGERNNNSTNQQNMADAAVRFDQAADLAEDAGVPCVPEDDEQGGLTPHFDVAGLIADGRCEPEIQASVDPITGRNERVREHQELEAISLGLEADLAAQFAVPCE